MPSALHRRRRRLRHWLVVSLVVIALVAVIWIDIGTGLWAETVILSGVAAGLLTFFLTALLFDRLIARGEHRRWLPVTRLALTDLLHTLADDERSELRRDHIVPRTLTVPTNAAGRDQLLHEVLAERQRLTEAIGRWAGFLAGSADVRDLMDHIAELALQLERIRDLAVETDGNDDMAPVAAAVGDYRARVTAAVAEIRAVLRADAAVVEED